MMKKLLLSCLSLLLLLSFTLSVFATSTPVADDGKWYYVKSQRYGSGGPWWTYNSTSLTVVPGALTKSNTQKFTLVTTVAGKVTVKEFGGNKLTAGSSTGLFSAAGAATGWTITPNTVGGIAGTAFPGESSGIHQGGSGWGWKLSAGYYDLGDNCTFFFYEATADIDLQIAVDDATSLLNTYSVGTAPGTVPQAAHDAFLSAINTAKTTLGSTDNNAIQSAITTLASATVTFGSAVILPVQKSTALAPKWYYVTNAGRTINTLYNGVLTIDQNNKLTISTINTATPTAAQLFRFEGIPGNVGFRVVAAINQSGEMKSTTSPGTDVSTSAAIPYGTSANTAWTLGTLTGSGANQYKFVSSNGWNIHADGNLNVVRWDDGYGSASAWTFTALSANASDEQVTLGYMITAAQNILNSTTQGTTDGTYPAQARTTLSAAITTAQAFNPAGKTQTEILQAESALDAAISAYAGTLINGSSPLRSTAASPVWYVLQCTVRNAVISAKTGGAGTIGRPTISEPTDSIMWRVEYDATSKNYGLVNKLTGKYMNDWNTLSASSSFIWSPDEIPAGSGTYRFYKGSRPLPSNNWPYLHMAADKVMTYWYGSASETGSQYQAISGITVHKNAMKTTLDSINTAKVSYTIGTAVGQYPQSARTQLDAACTAAQTLYDNASATYDQAAAGRTTIRAAWKTFTQSQNTITGFKSSENTKVTVYSVKNLIVVKGTADQARAFTITGTEVDITRPLKTGVYIVKTAGQTFKVNVE